LGLASNEHQSFKFPAVSGLCLQPSRFTGQMQPYRHALME